MIWFLKYCLLSWEALRFSFSEGTLGWRLLSLHLWTVGVAWGSARVVGMISRVLSGKWQGIYSDLGEPYKNGRLRYLQDLNPGGRGNLRCALLFWRPPACDFGRWAALIWLAPARVGFQPASLRHTGEFEIFLPPPFLLFLFHVNSSCCSNIDKYSRECFSGRWTLPKHFLTIFGKNWSFRVFQTDWKSGRLSL